MYVHEEVSYWCNPLVPPCWLKCSMTNKNMEVVVTSPSYVCGERRAPHAHTRLPHRAGPDVAWRGESRIERCWGPG